MIKNGIADVSVEAIQWVLPEMFQLVPGVERCKFLVGAGEHQLYADAAINGASLAFTVCGFHPAILPLHAFKRGRRLGALRTPVFLPVKGLQSPLLELQNLFFFQSTFSKCPVWRKGEQKRKGRKIHEHVQEGYQCETRYDVLVVCKEHRCRPCGISSAGECHHVPRTRNLPKIKRIIHSYIWFHDILDIWRQTLYRIKFGAIDGEKRDLIDLRPEDCEPGILARQRKTPVAWGELGLVEEEGLLGRECKAEGKPIKPLDFRIRTWIENIICITPFCKYHCYHHHHQQHVLHHNHHRPWWQRSALKWQSNMRNIKEPFLETLNSIKYDVNRTQSTPPDNEKGPKSIPGLNDIEGWLIQCFFYII